ncbi:U7 snRNA-associated Sm-like protein LSm10 [Camponotus floridanus]|uniref:U7 snRNA-associated Sm-like protein LSm10 n=1 Tax=Camponotus floridanus TaxID=104421 RepID=E2A453_CAMFO|nr:U7 snRNA-associated Sm-like protein LSm10 [Camponotus floridanus]EFN71819.1 U7 snRNA-associated Sm-like protein LSm10 [Camponotus floridanus]
MSLDSKRERHFLYNSLSILLKAVEKQRTIIDLRNEASIFGIVEQTDAYMNVVMRDCVFTDPREDSFKFDMFFVQARNIRCVHIPPHIRIIPAIKEQLKRLSYPSKEMKNTKYTFKNKRTQQRQQESLEAVEQILESRETKSQFTK